MEPILLIVRSNREESFSPYNDQRRKMDKKGAKWVHVSKSRFVPENNNGTYKKPKQ